MQRNCRLGGKRLDGNEPLRFWQTMQTQIAERQTVSVRLQSKGGLELQVECRGIKEVFRGLRVLRILRISQTPLCMECPERLERLQYLE